MTRIAATALALVLLVPALASATTEIRVTSTACETFTVSGAPIGSFVRLDYHDYAHAAEVTVKVDPETWTDIVPGGLWYWTVRTPGQNQSGDILAEGSVELAVCSLPSEEPPAPTAEPTPTITLPPTDTVR